jgi:hypothetical protein
MNYIKMLGILAMVLGGIVILVATMVSVQRMQLALNPLILGIAACLAGFLSIKKAQE